MFDEVSYLIDSNVLIDYFNSDPSILKTFSDKIGMLHVATTTLAKVRQLDETACQRLNITLITPAENQIDQAIQNQVSVAFDDYVCLLIAKSQNLILITNDERLRKICEENGVDFI